MLPYDIFAILMTPPCLSLTSRKQVPMPLYRRDAPPAMLMPPPA
jgi:hypothetical protein